MITHVASIPLAWLLTVAKHDYACSIFFPQSLFYFRPNPLLFLLDLVLPSSHFYTSGGQLLPTWTLLLAEQLRLAQPLLLAEPLLLDEPLLSAEPLLLAVPLLSDVPLLLSEPHP